MKRPTQIIRLALWLLAQIPTLGAADWPRFRGPTGDGLALAAKPPLQWSETRNLAWKTALPGRARSSPVVQGDYVWLTTAKEGEIRRTRIGPDDMQVTDQVALGAVCLARATGQIVWQVTLFDISQPDPVHWLNSWATPTPVIEAGRLYCDFGTFGTACLDAASGKVVWTRRLPLDHQVGPGSSPVVHQNLLILVRDGRDAQYVSALDKRTGQTVWKTDRPPLEASSNNLKKSFSTPVLLAVGGQAQLLSPGAQWVVSYDLASGHEIWRVRHGNGFSIGTCPVVGHGLAFVGTGCFKPDLLAIKTEGRGDVTTSNVVWRITRQVPVMSSPVLVGDELYWVADDGIACCADARSGKVHWQERLGGSHLASPLYADGRLYFFNQEGKTTVLSAQPQFKRLAENQLEGTVIATPAAVDRALFVRTDTHLYRLEEP